MSLLVVNSSSKVAQGIIRHLHKTGQYENIICADLFPNYWGIQSQVNFLHSVDKKASKTQLTESNISSRQDLEQQISKASHVLYVNHDYYTNVADKNNLIKTTANLVEQYGSSIKQFVAVNPSEHDHYGEPNAQQLAAQAQKEAQQISERLVNIRSDVVFGKDSSVLSLVVKHLQYGRHFTLSPSQSGNPSPIHSNCLSHGVATALQGGQEGKLFNAEGSQQIDWRSLVGLLEQSTALHRKSDSQIENVISPLSNNLLSEFLYRDTYRNAVQYINQYQNLPKDGAAPITELGVKPISVTEYYKDRKLKRVESFEVPDQSESDIKKLVY